MTALQNRVRAGGFIQSEANPYFSRDRVIILGGTTGAGALVAGTVLGKITSGGKYVASPASGSDGSQTAVAILWDDVDATDGDVIATVVNAQCEVRADDLTYDPTVDTDNERAAKWAQLLAVGIKVRV